MQIFLDIFLGHFLGIFLQIFLDIFLGHFSLHFFGHFSRHFFLQIFQKIIVSQSKRLISPLKYVRRPRRDGGPIYKLDDSKASGSSGKKSSDTSPITFKVLSKTESAVIPTHLEIPFLQDRMTILIKNKNRQKAFWNEFSKTRTAKRYIRNTYIRSSISV